MDDESEQPPLPSLRRRNSIPSPIQFPSKLTLPNGNGDASSPPLDLELISLKPTTFGSYTSLKDILPSSPSVAINSPTAAGSATNSGYEISIRNRLVKQAAWAYLQPMSASPHSSPSHFFARLWLHFSSCLGFFQQQLIPGLTQLVDRILTSIRILFNLNR